MNDFVVHRQRLPCAVRGQVVALAVELFEVEILHVAHERGKAPGHMVVVALDDKGQARQGDAGGVKSRRLEVSHEPDVGHGEAEVHIV